MPCIHDAHVVPPAVSILICTLLSDLCQHDRSLCVCVCLCVCAAMTNSLDQNQMFLIKLEVSQFDS